MIMVAKLLFHRKGKMQENLILPCVMVVVCVYVFEKNVGEGSHKILYGRVYCIGKKNLERLFCKLSFLVVFR